MIINFKSKPLSMNDDVLLNKLNKAFVFDESYIRSCVSLSSTGSIYVYIIDFKDGEDILLRASSHGTRSENIVNFTFSDYHSLEHLISEMRKYVYQGRFREVKVLDKDILKAISLLCYVRSLNVTVEYNQKFGERFGLARLSGDISSFYFDNYIRNNFNTWMGVSQRKVLYRVNKYIKSYFKSEEFENVLKDLLENNLVVYNNKDLNRGHLFPTVKSMATLGLYYFGTMGMSSFAFEHFFIKMTNEILMGGED